MKNVLDKIFELTQERLSSPAFVTFSVSFVLVNYPFLLMFFSGDKINIKLEMLGDYEFKWCIPILFTVFYLFIYPFLDLRITWAIKWIENHKAEKLLKINKSTPVAQDKIDERFKFYEDKTKNYDQDLAKMESMKKDKIHEIQCEIGYLKKRLAKFISIILQDVNTAKLIKAIANKEDFITNFMCSNIGDANKKLVESVKLNPYLQQIELVLKSADLINESLLTNVFIGWDSLNNYQKIFRTEKELDEILNFIHIMEFLGMVRLKNIGVDGHEVYFNVEECKRFVKLFNCLEN